MQNDTGLIDTVLDGEIWDWEATQSDFEAQDDSEYLTSVEMEEKALQAFCEAA